MGNRAALNRLYKQRKAEEDRAWCAAHIEQEEMKVVVDTARELAELADIAARRAAFPLH